MFSSLKYHALGVVADEGPQKLCETANIQETRDSLVTLCKT